MLLLFLLLFGSVNGAWCFKIGTDSVVPELELYDSHFVPAACLTSEDMKSEDKSNAVPTDCHKCLDLSFADIATGIQTCRVDYDSTLSIYNYFSSVLFLPDLKKEGPAFYFLNLQQKTDLNIHPSIPSTVLII